MNACKVMIDVTFIVPVYNCGDYIEQCISSIAGIQGISKEVVVINDGSSDSTNANCEILKNRYDFIKYISIDNSGVSFARNFGLNVASGKWVIFVDGDDFLNDTISEFISEVLISTADIIVTDYYCVSENTKIREQSFKEEAEGFLNKKVDQYIFDVLIGDKSNKANLGVPWAKIYRKDFLIENNIQFPVGLKRMQDSIFNLYAFYYAKSVYYSHVPIYCYRIWSNSSVHRYSPDFSETKDKILYEINKFCDKYSIDSKFVMNTISLKNDLLFIEWCKLYPCHYMCKLPFSKKIELIKIQERGISRKDERAMSFFRKNVSLLKYIIINVFCHRLYVIGYLLLRLYDVTRLKPRNG